MWRLLDLGSIDGYTMTNLYEAVGKSVSTGSSQNTLILNNPEKPFVNIGYHQIMEKEIDVDYAREMGFDLVRRTLGGGAILDGPWEQDYFFIVHRDSEECPKSIPDFYGRFLKPPLYALRKYGLKAQIRPPNDILVGNCKISGNGAITVDDVNILAGDILLELPLEHMMRIIKAPSEKYRDKLAKSMEEWLTSLNKELGIPADREELKRFLIEGFQKEIGIVLEPGDLTSDEQKSLEKLISERKSEDWIFSKDFEYHRLLTSERVKGTKVMGGVAVYESIHKAGKLVRITLTVSGDKINGISISGDFFTQPYMESISFLEEALVGVPLKMEDLRKKIANAYNRIGLKTFGVTAEDLAIAIMKTKGDLI